MNNIDCLSLSNIISFLYTIDNIALSKACKTINKQMINQGYLTTITLTQDNYINHLKKKQLKKRLVNTVTMLHFDKPLLWLPFHANKIILKYCDETYEDIIVFCMSSNYEIVTHNDNLIILLKSQDQPQLQDI